MESSIPFVSVKIEGNKNFKFSCIYVGYRQNNKLFRKYITMKQLHTFFPRVCLYYTRFFTSHVCYFTSADNIIAIDFILLSKTSETTTHTQNFPKNNSLTHSL